MADLFPLPVSPFEYYYLCDDRAEYPTTFFLELTFSGPLERGPLEGALAFVLSRHPLLTARIDMNNGGRPNWLAGAGPQLDWGAEDEPLLARPGLRIDLASAPGLRVWAREGPNRSRIVFQFHHACCDGLAGGRFAEELVLAYHALFDSSGPPLPPLDPLRLKHRDESDEPVRTTWRDVWNTADFWTRVLVRPPAVVAAPRENASAAATSAADLSELSPILAATLSVEETRRLRRAATAQHVTLNDVLLRDLFLALGQWNAEHGASGRLRINVPALRREKLSSLMPATNALGFAFLTRRVRPHDDPEALLQSIHREMDAIKQERRGRYFLGGLAFACGFRGLVPWALSRERCFATTVLSNLGRIGVRTPLPQQGRKSVVGRAVLERVAGAPPLRPDTRAAFAIFQYAGETTISGQCDRRYFDAAAADELLAQYMTRLRQSSGPSSTEPIAPSETPILTTAE